ncbi:MAG: hypothetical protein ACPGN3_14300 [Opitutales bacterium]
MRKIHEAYEKLQNPWYRDWRYLLAVSLGLLVLGIGGYAGFQLISEKNREQTLDHIDEAFSQNDLSSVYRTLNLARKGDATDEGLKVQHARFLSRVQPRAAVEAWRDVVQSSQEPEHAVAFVLAAINVKDFEAAQFGVTSLKKYPDAESAYRRAAFVLAFAEGRDPDAFEHIEVLKQLEPDNIQYKIEHARIGVRSPDDALRAASESFLWEIADEQVNWSSVSLKGLANSFIERNEPNNLMRVLERARDIEAGTQVGSLLWAIEAEQRMWGDVPVDNVRDVWDISISAGEQEIWLKLVTWMNTFGFANQVLDWGTERPSKSVWMFPSGYLLARSALQTDQASRVTEGLRNANWGDRDFLRLLMLSLLTERGNSRTFWLDQAYQAADSSVRGGGRMLMPLLWEWGWLEAEVLVMSRVLEKIPVAPAALRGLFQRIEDAGDLTLMYQLSRALLKQFPDQPALMNNAAYYAAILNRDMDAALGWAQAAADLHPDATEFLSTVALIHAANGDLEKAQEILKTLDDSAALMARLVTSSQLGQNTAQWTGLILNSQSLMAQEKEFVKRWGG